MKIRIELLAILILLFTAGCKKGDITPKIEESYFLKVTPESHTFPESGGEVVLNVIATNTISSISDGIVKDTKIEDVPYTISLTGDGFELIGDIIKASKNEGAPRIATATITIDGTSEEQKVNLIQQGEGEISETYALEVSPLTYGFPYLGGTLMLEISSIKTISTIVDEIIMDTKTEEVPYVITVDGSGFTLNGNIITASANTGIVRTATVTVTPNGYASSAKTINITQGGSGFHPDSYTLDGTKLTKWNGTEKTIDLSTDPIFDNVTEIAVNAFNSTVVETITISKNITVISDQAFSTANDLMEFKVAEGNTVFFATSGVLFKEMGGGNISLYKFPRGKSTAGYVMPSGIGITHIDQYAFAYLSGLTSLTVAEGVVSMNYRAFYASANLTSLTLPLTLTNIGNNVFAGVSNFTEVHVKNPTPFSVGATNNFGANVANATLYVPTGTKTAYAAHAQWSKFKEIVEE